MRPASADCQPARARAGAVRHWLALVTSIGEIVAVLFWFLAGMAVPYAFYLAAMWIQFNVLMR